MSFSKTVSVVAALASIFGAGAAGFKLAQDSQNVDSQSGQPQYEERITELQEQVSNLQKQTVDVNPPAPVQLPQSTVVKQQPPEATPLPAPESQPVPPAPTPPTTSSQP